MRKTFHLVASSIVLASLATFGGCSSGGSTSGSGGQPSAAQAMQFCTASCAKEATCNPAFMIDCAAECAPTDASLTSTQASVSNPNCNANAFLGSANACLSGTCAALDSCIAQATISSGCGTDAGAGSGSTTGSASGAGSGATTGSGSGATSGSTTGSTSVFGDAGPASCSDCTKAQACCVALDAVGGGGGDGGECSEFSAVTCASLGTQQSEYAMGCQAVVALGALANVPACI